MAKLWYGYDDFKLPVVVGMKMSGYVGLVAEYLQTMTSYFMHMHSLKIAFPTNAYDAKGKLKKTVLDDNPVVVLEHILHYGQKEEVPEEYYSVPFGEV
jgi:pyruvate dehydrogenase E1 component beta subunit